MKRKSLDRITYFPVYMLFFCMLMGLGACSIEDQPESDQKKEVSLKASIDQGNEPRTRTVTYKPVTYTDYGHEPFYIYTKAPNVEVVWPYNVASGQIGRLMPADESNKLLWYNQTTNHTFTGWTLPWGTDDWTVGKDTKTKIWFLGDKYREMGESNYLNCRVLEKFIGAKTEPLNYEDNGEVVDMYFQHLVSKIHIDPLILIENDGTTIEGLEAVMTFYQLPQWAFFDRLPTNGGAPVVIKDPEADLGVSCTIASQTTLWVCPEVDFSQMKFSIHIKDTNKGNSDYFGDFGSVVFQRDEEDPWDEGKSSKILYAGEEMTIRLTVRDGNQGGFVTVNIAKWSDQGWRDATSHPRRGVYSGTEFQDLYNRFAGGQQSSSRPDGYTQEDVDEVFEMFGQEVVNEDGEVERVIFIYDDITTPHRQMPFPSGDLILDGTDHTVTEPDWQMKMEFPNGEKKTCHVCRVCNCRNIYISNGTSTIYIDADGKIWLVDSETLQKTETPYTLPPEGVEFSNSRSNYYIDYETGFCSYYAESV